MEQTTEEKLAEALKQLAASQAQTKQAEQSLNTERQLRGKAEQALSTEQQLRGKAEQDLKDTTELVDQLNQANSEAAPERKAPIVTLGSGATAKKYRIVVPQFQLAGFGVVKAEDVKSNSDVLKKLVEVGSGVVELVQAT